MTASLKKKKEQKTMAVCQISVSWEADNADKHRLTQILLIISKINLRLSAYSASSASGNVNLKQPHVKSVASHCLRGTHNTLGLFRGFCFVNWHHIFWRMHPKCSNNQQTC